MIKKVLVGIDTSEQSRAAQSFAFYLARRFNASVLGLHVIDIVSIEGPFFHDISGSLGLEPYLDLASRMREAMSERGRALLEAFAVAGSREKVHVETLLDVGVVPNQICERAKLADLIAIGHRAREERFSTGLMGSTAESVTRRSPRPVLIACGAFREISHPVLAYDGSPRASKAMGAAGEFAAHLGIPLTVVTVARDAKLGEQVLGEARSYFTGHPATVSFELLSGHAHEGIVGYLKASGCDLLFIGAYGHSRIVEMVLGSTTEYVLRNSPCPVFLLR